MPKLSETIDKLKKVEQNTREVIVKIIMNVQLNDDEVPIVRNCFTVKSSVVFEGRTLSPEYYNFQHTATHICKYVMRCRIESLIPFLTEIVVDGSVRYPYRGYTSHIAIPVRQHINDKFFNGELKMGKISVKRVTKSSYSIL